MNINMRLSQNNLNLDHLNQPSPSSRHGHHSSVNENEEEDNDDPSLNIHKHNKLIHNKQEHGRTLSMSQYLSQHQTRQSSIQLGYGNQNVPLRARNSSISSAIIADHNKSSFEEEQHNEYLKKLNDQYSKNMRLNGQEHSQIPEDEEQQHEHEQEEDEEEQDENENENRKRKKNMNQNNLLLLLMENH